MANSTVAEPNVRDIIRSVGKHDEALDKVLHKAAQLQAVAACIAFGGDVEEFKLSLGEDDWHELRFLAHDLASDINQQLGEMQAARES